MKRRDINIVVDSFEDREDLLELMKISSYDSLLYSTDYIERIVRSSPYYVLWRQWEKEHCNATIDSIENINTSNYSKLSLELHHYPYTLFDIVQHVGRKLLDEKEETTPFEISKLVLQEHLLGNIGYVPLLITDHQKNHSGLLELEDTHIHGDYTEFERKYL